jgi:MoaA/NifB/PqqE/SkfB family radical SAM enzyme
MSTSPYWKRSLRLLQTISAKKPAICTIQVTNRCNMQCSFCAFWSDGAPPPNELTLAQIIRISEKLAEVGSMIISVEGGEPMLRPDLIEIVRALAAHHHPVLYTNGWFVTEENAKRLFDAGMVQVGVSLDYASPESHDAHRLPGSFERVVRAVEHFQRAAKDPKKQIHLMTVLMDDNLDELEPLFALSRSLQIRHRVTLLATQGKNRAGGKTLPNQNVTEALRGLKKKYPHFVDLTSYIDGMDAFLQGTFSNPCQAGSMGFNINHLGFANPCIEKADVSVGKILELPTDVLLQRLSSLEEVKGCQSCYTLCRGHVQAVSSLSPKNLSELLL